MKMFELEMFKLESHVLTVGLNSIPLYSVPRVNVRGNIFTDDMTKTDSYGQLIACG